MTPFDTSQHRRSQGLGYEYWQEQICGDIVSAGRRDYQEALNREHQASLLEQEYVKLTNGSQQKVVDDLKKSYDKAVADKVKTERELFEAKQRLDRWKENPELNYEHYVQTGSGMAGWLNDFVDGVKRTAGNILTAGQGCQSAQTERNNDAKRLSDASHRLGNAEKALDEKKKQLKADTETLPRETAIVKSEIKELVDKKEAVEKEMASIIDKYQLRRNQEKLALEQEALNRENSEKEAAETAKEQQNAQTVQTLILAATVAAAAFILLSPDKK